MEPKRVIFISAVSNEFHRVPAEQRQNFQSYRDVLKQAFRILAPHYEVVVQEDLVHGFGDLLETLEHEIARSLFVIHLVGDLAGLMPGPGALRSLHARHPDLLAGVPELSAAVGDGDGITYTQWELYLAFHHRQHPLIFLAQPGVPRSPFFSPTPADQVSQSAHLRRIKATDYGTGTFQDQGDVARKCMRAFLHFRVDPLVEPVEPSADELAEAWAHQEEIVKQLAAAIKKPNPRAVPVADPANTAAFVAAVRGAAERWQVNLAAIVDIAARHEEQVRAVVEYQPTAAALYDEAFAQLALGDYTAARFSARRAADVALQFLQQQPANGMAHREDAQNALLLLHEAAKAAHDIPTAIAALEEAGALIDKEAEPVRWADVHEPLAEFLLDQAKLDPAEDLISDIIDIREEHQGENHPAFAGVLLVWTRLLNARANYPGMEGVAARAERIFAGQTPCDFPNVFAAMSQRALGLCHQNRLAEAEPLMQQVAAFFETSDGADHPSVALALNNLATLLLAMDRPAEAEPILRRALAIDEQNYGPEHPNVSRELNNLAQLLQTTNRMVEAEPLLRRGLAIDELSYGPYHPNVALRLNNLAQLLKATDRLDEAEPLLRRSLEIMELGHFVDHPYLSSALNNLAGLLHMTNRLREAEPLLRRALAIEEHTYGPDHPNVAICLNNLGTLLEATNRMAEAEPLLRRPLEIFIKSTVTTQHEHRHLQAAIRTYVSLLQRMGHNQDEIRAQLDALGRPFGIQLSSE
jgi:tetratricopeptide (TPR) repeat protein